MVSLQFYNYILILSLLYFSSASLIKGYTYTPCNGSIADCDVEGEMLMESEISRRVLAQRKYITPGALKPDQPVCKGAKGEAYSKAGDCLPEQSNPPDRGCQKYYRCRSSS
ncbi:hypothetical protein L484_026861 [Morus notabilis]|uniref:Protein RALF-like 32 n=1 Tax=Morus notabilis TaxID=981085 RepID=W9RGL7_9ROSA|nr:protein RALF-like 32 [Morus notabilis]EXB73698.1 hypothetical protein L484_026861 [Morus notabilis]